MQCQQSREYSVISRQGSPSFRRSCASRRFCPWTYPAFVTTTTSSRFTSPEAASSFSTFPTRISLCPSP